MLEFMEFVQHAFYEASKWNTENSYTTLTATSRALLDFDTPRGLRLNVSSLASPNYGASYALGNVGYVDGSLSYLYSSIPLRRQFQSKHIDLHDVIRGYRQIQELPVAEEAYTWEQWKAGKRIDKRDRLLYGRLYLPQSTLEALYVKRNSPTSQIKLSVVSDAKLKNGGTVLAQYQCDVGKYSTEGLFSTDSGLLGVKGLYNFGPDPRKESTQLITDDRVYGRFSAGAELYYGTMNKSGGMSVGGRFATLPSYGGIPLTATLTLNPLMGSLSATYAVRAGEDLSLCSRFDFNAYSYESDLVFGCELWRKKLVFPRPKERSMEAKLAWTTDPETPPEPPRTEIVGVLKARVDQNYRIGVLWEGRMKDFLFSLGSTLDLRKTEQPFRSLGLELQYSS